MDAAFSISYVFEEQTNIGRKKLTAYVAYLLGVGKDGRIVNSLFG